MTESKVPDLIGLILLGILASGIIFLLINFVFANIIPLFAEGSTEVVSRDLADLITISGIAPYKITIDYQPTDNTVYNVSIDSRVLTLYTLENNPKPLTLSTGVSQYTNQKVAVGNSSTSLHNVNNFEITKTAIIANQQRQNLYSVTGK